MINHKNYKSITLIAILKKYQIFLSLSLSLSLFLRTCVCMCCIINESNILLHTVFTAYIYIVIFFAIYNLALIYFFFLFFDPLKFKQNCLISIIATAIRIFPVPITLSLF